LSESSTETERRRIRGRRLTDRQTIVLEFIAEGLENKEIAHRMGLSEQAVKEQVSALLDRLAARNRAALAEIATQLRIVGTMDLEPEWLVYIYQRSPVMSAVVRGPDHRFVSANDAFRRAAGAVEIVGRTFIEAFPQNPHGVPLLDEVRATGIPKVIHEITGRWLRADGLEDGYATVVLQPLPGADAGIGISVVDVTEPVRARKSLAELSAEQLAVLDHVPGALVVTDRGGAVVKVNRAAQTLFGSVVPPPIEGALGRALQGETIRDARVRIFLPALGRDASMRIDAQPLRTVDGAVHAVVTSFSEIAPDATSG